MANYRTSRILPTILTIVVIVVVIAGIVALAAVVPALCYMYFKHPDLLSPAQLQVALHRLTRLIPSH